MEIKSVNPKLRWDQTAKDLSSSSSTLKRYRNDINMLSTYGISPNNHKVRQNISNTNIDDKSNREHGFKMTSNDSKKPQKVEVVKRVSNVVSISKKNKLKGGSLWEFLEINDEYLDEILHNNNLWTELAMQIISNERRVRSNTVQDLKEFNSQSLSTQAKKGEQLFSMVPAIEKTFDLMGNDIVELSTDNESLKKNRLPRWKIVGRI